MSILARIARISQPFHGTLIVGLLLIVISTALDTAVLPILFGALIFAVLGQTGMREGGGDTALLHIDILRLLPAPHTPDDKFQLLVTLAMITGAVVLVKTICQARHAYLLHQFANLVARDIRQRVFGQLLRLPPSYFEKESTGSSLTRVTGDVAVLHACLGPQLGLVLNAPLAVVVSLTVMVLLNWRLALATLVLAPLIATVMAIGGRMIRKQTILIQGRLSELNAALVERLGNVRIIQSFVREPFEREQVAAFNQQYYRSTMRSVLIAEVLAPSVELIAYVGMILGIILGGWQVLHGHMDGKNFFTFLLIAQRAGSQFRGLSQINQIRQQANAAGARIFEILDQEPQIRTADNAQPLPPVRGAVTFDGVSFQYHEGETVLRDINLQVAPGQIIALVGPSGSGKTTLVNLLPRFYDVTAGSIRIDGADIRQVTLASLREQIGIVPQETVLFSGTILENIRYGKLDASEAEIREAAQAANALEFIERLPEGFQTLVGERGTRLSGGQRQRVAIARALLKNPRILILDEATSALDTESELLVQQALERLMEARTTFVIAHRLSTIMHAHAILVLDGGVIRETGTHEELLAQDGLYKRLYEIQFRGEAKV